MPTGIEGVMVEGGRGGRCHPVGGFAEGRRSVGLTLEMTHRRRVKIPPPNRNPSRSGLSIAHAG